MKTTLFIFLQVLLAILTQCNKHRYLHWEGCVKWSFFWSNEKNLPWIPLEFPFCYISLLDAFVPIRQWSFPVGIIDIFVQLWTKIGNSFNFNTNVHWSWSLEFKLKWLLCLSWAIQKNSNISYIVHYGKAWMAEFRLNWGLILKICGWLCTKIRFSFFTLCVSRRYGFSGSLQLGWLSRLWPLYYNSLNKSAGNSRSSKH